MSYQVNDFIGTGLDITTKEIKLQADGSVKEYGLFTPEGSLRIASGATLINQSIAMILGSVMNERFFNPTFGSKLPNILFDGYEPAFQDLAETYIKQALFEQEPRISVTDIQFAFEKQSYEKGGQNKVSITIKYKILDTNITSSTVYEMSVSEGGN